MDQKDDEGRRQTSRENVRKWDRAEVVDYTGLVYIFVCYKKVMSPTRTFI